MAMAYKRLGELLVAAGAITEEELEKGLQLLLCVRRSAMALKCISMMLRS